MRYQYKIKVLLIIALFYTGTLCYAQNELSEEQQYEILKQEIIREMDIENKANTPKDIKYYFAEKVLTSSPDLSDSQTFDLKADGSIYIEYWSMEAEASLPLEYRLSEDKQNWIKAELAEKRDNNEWKYETYEEVKISMPSCLASYHTERGPYVPESDIDRIARFYPDPVERAKVLFYWYGTHSGTWREYFAYESVPVKYLEKIAPNDLYTAAMDENISRTHLEGAARYFWTSEFGERISESDYGIPFLLKIKIVNYIATKKDKLKMDYIRRILNR